MKKAAKPEASDKDLNAAARLGRRMAKEDTWITPVYEDKDDYENFGEFTMHHRGGWEETCQFGLLWDERLRNLVDAAADRYYISSTADWQSWHYGFYEPMKEALWDAWEAKVKLYEGWEKERKRRACPTK